MIKMKRAEVLQKAQMQKIQDRKLFMFNGMLTKHFKMKERTKKMKVEIIFFKTILKVFRKILTGSFPSKSYNDPYYGCKLIFFLCGMLTNILKCSKHEPDTPFLQNASKIIILSSFKFITSFKQHCLFKKVLNFTETMLSDRRLRST